MRLSPQVVPTVAAGLCFLVVVGALQGAGPDGSSPGMVFPGEDWVEASPESQGVDGDLLEEAMRVLAGIGEDHADGTPHTGTTRTVVIRNGRMIWKGSDVDTVQPIYSCTKSLTSSVFGLLIDDGKCTPSTPAAEAYPPLAEHYSQARLGHFANLTSGYSVPWRQPPLEIRPPDFVPGSRIHYNAQGHMFAYLLQRLAGESMSELWRERIASSIGIPDGAWDWRAVGEVEGMAVTGGASGMQISARQMARFGHLYLNKGRWAGRRVLSENWVEQSTVPQVARHTPCFEGEDAWYNVLPGRYGYMWWTNGIGADGRRFWENAPDGTFFAQGNRNNYCIVVPEWKMVLVHLDRGKAISGRLYDGVFAILRRALGEYGGATR